VIAEALAVTKPYDYFSPWSCGSDNSDYSSTGTGTQFRLPVLIPVAPVLFLSTIVRYGARSFVVCLVVANTMHLAQAVNFCMKITFPNEKNFRLKIIFPAASGALQKSREPHATTNRGRHFHQLIAYKLPLSPSYRIAVDAFTSSYTTSLIPPRIYKRCSRNFQTNDESIPPPSSLGRPALAQAAGSLSLPPSLPHGTASVLPLFTVQHSSKAKGPWMGADAAHKKMA